MDAYVAWLVAEVHPSLDVAPSVAREVREASPDGADHVTELLDRLNLRFQSLVDALRDRLRQLAALHPEDKQLAVC